MAIYTQADRGKAQDKIIKNLSLLIRHRMTLVKSLEDTPEHDQDHAEVALKRNQHDLQLLLSCRTMLEDVFT